MREAGNREKLNGRAIILSVLLAILFSAINGYLSINIGSSFGYGAMAILIAYSLFHNFGGGTSRRELSFVLISSASALGLYYGLSLTIYMLETDPGLSFPPWMAPSREAVLQGSLNLRYWITPISFLVFTTILSVIVGLIFTYILREEFIRNDKMIWPNAAANASLVDACVDGGGSARLVGIAALVEFLVTFLQNIPSFWGYNFTTLDLTKYLPEALSSRSPSASALQR